MENSKCCDSSKNKGIGKGIAFGLIPHIGCIAFVLASILGLTVAASIFKPLLAKAYFFYAMIALSFVFATFSAFFYIRKNGGKVRDHKKYLTILYGTTIGVGLLLYFVIFPALLSFNLTGNVVSATPSDSTLTLKVQIPCEGHAPLIVEELKKVEGITSVKYQPTSTFIVSYDSSKVSEKQILEISIFKEFPVKKA